MENLENVIDNLVNKFSESLNDMEDKNELTNAFKEFLHKNVELKDKIDSSFKINDESAMIYILDSVTDDAIKLTLDQKKQMLLKDESFEKIRKISNKAFEMTQEVLAKEITELDEQEIEKMINTLNQSLKDVKDYNKQQAEWLVSEGILDLNFVKNPNTTITSIRLGKRLYSK